MIVNDIDSAVDNLKKPYSGVVSAPQIPRGIDEIAGINGHVTYTPIFLSLDNAIWFFQVIGQEIHIVDYHASSLKEIEFYANYLREWKKSNGVEYGTQFVPHDARHRRLGMGGKSILQQFQDHNVGRFVIVANLDVQEGIQSARATFPRVRFDAKRCEDGIECLKQYYRKRIYMHYDFM